MKKMQKKVNIELFRIRYPRSNCEGKTKLLNELIDLYGFNRKYLIQVFNGLIKKQHIKRGRKPIYSPEELLPHLMKEGFMHGKSRAVAHRIADRKAYTKHILRFRSFKRIIKCFLR
jgi:hypothetical protein